MPETVILLAHGSALTGAFSNPKVKIITKAGEPLYSPDVRAYFAGGSAPEFASSSLGHFSGVEDALCQQDVGVIPGAGPGFVDSGKRRGGTMTGYRIFVLRNQDVSFAEIGIWAQQFGKVILLACRS